MRLPLLALLVFALPTLSAAAAPVTREQCAATTAKLLQEGRYKDVAELFVSAKEQPRAKFDETVSQLEKTFSVLGKLSNIKPITNKPDGHSIKLEVKDAQLLLPSQKFLKAVHSMHAAVGGDVYLDVSYQMAQPNCNLIAVAVHLPREDAGNTSMTLSYESSNEAYFKEFQAILAAKKITNYKVEKTSINGKPGYTWKVITLPFALPGGPGDITAYVAPFEELGKKKPGQFNFTATTSFSASWGTAKP